MIRVLALTLCATPAIASDTCGWGRPGTTASIAPHATAAAQVIIQNRLSFRDHGRPCNVTLNGLTVQVTYDPGPHREPDTFTVTPPEGYFAIPDWLVIDDDAGAVVLIYPIGSVGM